MISICLKSTKSNILSIIENYLDNESFPGIYYSQKKFKHYTNLIIHYKGSDIESFYDALFKILVNFYTEVYEKKYLRKQIYFDFFYFSDTEKKLLLESTLDSLNLPDNYLKKSNLIYNSLSTYFCENSSCNLDGFTNFRLFEYKKYLNTVLENTISSYVLEKEYMDYVNILTDYISLQNPQSDSLHLIYGTNIKLLLDEFGNVITNSSNSFVYLSDISFSTNDYILNSILSYLPKKLFIHLDSDEDSFIRFLVCIFKDKSYVCHSCEICNYYLKKEDKIF